jgi:imidazolonepropionase-like amidohydrolase
MTAHPAVFAVRSSLVVLAASGIALSHAQQVPPRVERRGALSPGALAITNVNAIPMTRDTVIRDATVLMRDGRIVAVGRNVTVPTGARRIDGRGKYLIPGLADMHTHLYSDDDAVPDTAAAAELGVMVANGVTTARLMIGTPEHLVLRRAVAAGDIVGPQLWVASPHLVGRQMPNGIVVTNEEEARAAVRQVADAKYDAVKITLFITRPVYDAIIDEAAKRRIPVVGHVDPQVGVPRALETDQQIEHLDSYFEAVLADTAPSTTSVTQQYVFNPKNWVSLDYVDDRKIAEIAGATARARTWSSPTLNVFNKAFADRETDEAIRSRPDWNMMPPGLRAGYLQARERYWSAANAVERTEARRKRYVDVRNRLVKAIHDSGGKILAGSDTPEWFHAYGWGLHRELQALVEAGLTPYEALAAATRNPAEFLNQSSEWGTLEPGARADFVLLDANPLEEIGNTMKIAAVGIGGRWLVRAELDRMIAAGTRAIDGAAP